MKELNYLMMVKNIYIFIIYTVYPIGFETTTTELQNSFKNCIQSNHHNILHNFWHRFFGFFMTCKMSLILVIASLINPMMEK